MTKRFLALVLAILVALSLCTPALAAVTEVTASGELVAGEIGTITVTAKGGNFYYLVF